MSTLALKAPAGCEVAVEELLTALQDGFWLRLVFGDLKDA